LHAGRRRDVEVFGDGRPLGEVAIAIRRAQGATVATGNEVSICSKIAGEREDERPRTGPSPEERYATKRYDKCKAPFGHPATSESAVSITPALKFASRTQDLFGTCGKASDGDGAEP